MSLRYRWTPRRTGTYIFFSPDGWHHQYLRGLSAATKSRKFPSASFTDAI